MAEFAVSSGGGGCIPGERALSIDGGLLVAVCDEEDFRFPRFFHCFSTRAA